MKLALAAIVLLAIPLAAQAPTPKISQELRAQMATLQRDLNADVAVSAQRELQYDKDQKATSDDYTAKAKQFDELKLQAYKEAGVSQADFSLDTNQLVFVPVPKPAAKPAAAPLPPTVGAK